MVNHKDKSEKRPEGNSSHKLVLMTKEIEWEFPFCPTDGIWIDNLRVQSVRFETATKKVSLQMFGIGQALDNLDAVKKQYPDWIVHDI